MREPGYEVRVRGRIGPALVRTFEPWTIQTIDLDTRILMPHASDAALHGLLRRLDDFELELVAVVPLGDQPARGLAP